MTLEQVDSELQRMRELAGAGQGRSDYLNGLEFGLQVAQAMLGTLIVARSGVFVGKAIRVLEKLVLHALGKGGVVLQPDIEQAVKFRLEHEVPAYRFVGPRRPGHGEDPQVNEMLDVMVEGVALQAVRLENDKAGHERLLLCLKTAQQSQSLCTVLSFGPGTLHSPGSKAQGGHNDGSPSQRNQGQNDGFAHGGAL